MAEPRLILAPGEHALALWPLAEKHIERATVRSDGMVTTDEHRDAVASGRRQLWLITDGSDVLAAGVTEAIKGVCFIWAFGGERMSEWFHLHKELETWARQNGLRGVRFYGREGWERALRKSGFKKRLVIMHKELSDG
jgi:hypothetical protein